MYCESFMLNHDCNLCQYMRLSKIIRLTYYTKYIIKILPTIVIYVTRNKSVTFKIARYISFFKDQCVALRV